MDGTRKTKRRGRSSRRSAGPQKHDATENIQRRKRIMAKLLASTGRSPSSAHSAGKGSARSGISNEGLAVGFLVLYLAVGTGFYCWRLRWDFASSFYYTVQSGLSIGFGVLSEEDELSRLFTTCSALMGALISTTMLSILFESAAARIVLMKRRDQERSDEEGDEEAALQSLGEKLLAHTTSKESLLLAFWLLMGVLYGSVIEGWTIITSLYFAVTSISTGGLMGPTNEAPYLLFTAVYCLVGVPLFAAATTQFATIWLDHRATHRLKEKMSQDRFLLSEFKEIAASHSPRARSAQEKDGSIDLAEFLCTQLEHLGLVNVEHLLSIVEKFHELDENGNGEITLTEAHKGNLLFGEHQADHQDADQLDPEGDVLSDEGEANGADEKKQRQKRMRSQSTRPKRSRRSASVALVESNQQLSNPRRPEAQ
eukprot:jgi/Bigna1/131697/aug1.15_g6405